MAGARARLVLAQAWSGGSAVVALSTARGHSRSRSAGVATRKFCVHGLEAARPAGRAQL